MSHPVNKDQPDIPDGYGLADTDNNLLEWEDVDKQLCEALHYWLSTTRPDGRPHVVPRWGAWIDGTLYYDGSPETVHARNLSTNQACTLHIGSGADAIIVDGHATASRPVDGNAGGLGEAIAAEIGRKYSALGYEPAADAWSGPDAGGLAIFSPSKALAWNSFPVDLTRFRFDPTQH